MEPTPTIFDKLVYPAAAYAEEIPNNKHLTTSLMPWESSQLNPSKRVLSLDSTQPSDWRIDGCEPEGTRFFAIPNFALNNYPLRIDVYLVTDELVHGDLGLLEVLAPSNAMLVASTKVSMLRISQHILRALSLWSSQQPNFEALYWSMPFGSRIIIETLRYDIHHMKLHLVPIYDIERQWLSIKALQTLWGLPYQSWPETVHLRDLQLHQQFHESISLVHIKHREDKGLLIFKSTVQDTRFLYHELKLLLSMAGHPNIVSRPLFVVTKDCRFGGKLGVCGFILKYYPLGTLRDAISSGPHDKPGYFKHAFRWARETVSALLYIQTTPARFYSDLKLNNILLAPGTDATRVVLVDFEQRGGWFSWSPPEVYFIECMEEIASSHLDLEVRKRYINVLQKIIPNWQPRSKSTPYQNEVQGYSNAWTSLTSAEQESAQIFMLGKLLWCLFEGVGSINSGMSIESFREKVCQQEFPEFKQTPQALRDCIKRCTKGAPEWEGRLPPIVRRANKLFPRGRTGEGGEPLGTAGETQRAATIWWRDQLERGINFLEARYRHQSRLENLPTDHHTLDIMVGRPTFTEVLQTIKEAEATVMCN